MEERSGSRSGMEDGMADPEAKRPELHLTIPENRTPGLFFPNLQGFVCATASARAWMDRNLVTMNYNHLYYFHVIAEEGSLARAAKRLHLSQPTLSTQLRQLEEYFEVRFFDRASGAMRLNANGRKALEVTKEMFHLAERLETFFPADHPPVKTRLEIGVATTVGRSFAIERFVSLFKSEEIMTRVRQGDHEYLMHELVCNGLDLLITDVLPDQRHDRGTEYRVLTAPDFVIVTCDSVDSIDELHGRPFVHYTSHSNYRFMIDQFFRERKIEPRVIAEADDVYVIRDAVAEGVGFGIVPANIVTRCDDGPPLRIIGRIDKRFEIYALYNRQDPSEEVLAALDVLSDTQKPGDA